MLLHYIVIFFIVALKHRTHDSKSFQDIFYYADFNTVFCRTAHLT